MVGRALVFAAWATLGAVASYGALYALTPFGLMILAGGMIVGAALVAYALAGRRPLRDHQAALLERPFVRRC